MAVSFQLLVAALLLAPCAASSGQQESAANANPIRKVVTMLQAMQGRITEEGKKEKEIYEKFMCYCKSSGSDLADSISAAEARISALPSEIDALEEQKAQDEAALKSAQENRVEAKAAMAEATAIREKDASTFAALKAEYSADIQSIVAATAAISKGMAGSFLQSDAAKALQRFVTNKSDMIDEDRQAVLAFISGTQVSGYTPSSGQITGILKEMGDDMGRSLADATSTEEEAIKTYESLMAAKTKEVNACTKAIESKTKAIGELGVDIVEKKNDLTETEAAYMEDKKYLADLDTNCAKKTSEWQVVVQTRAQELAALADTIKILNDDDALELFKKTLPGSSASLMQVHAGAVNSQKQALSLVSKARDVHGPHRAQYDLIALALTGKKVSFAKVVTMIDDMIKMLKEEQLDDDFKKEYCAKQFDFTDDKKKELERTLSLEEAAIDTAKEAIATLSDEMKSLEKGIKALDKAVAEATELRKEEHEDFTALMASDSAAKELLGLAKNRLNQFYNPKLYKPAPKRVLSAEDTIVTSFGGTLAPTSPPGGIAGTGVTVLAQISIHKHRAAPPPPPEAVGAYAKKGEESTGVISMIDLLVKDLEKEMTEAKTGEKEAQAEYETMMKDSALKRVQDSKSLAEKASSKAQAEGDLMSHTEAEKAAKKEHMATLEYEANLHAECDWLLQYFDVRKEARAGEVESLKSAKAVLSGADYSLAQQSRQSSRLLGRF